MDGVAETGAPPAGERKRAMRAQVRTALAGMAPARRALEEELVTAAVQQDPAWQAARVVLLYRSMAPEFTTVGLTLAAWRAGKRTVFPRVDPAGAGALVLHDVGSWAAFAPGFKGILEPVGGPTVPVAGVELAVVPGVAWDARGNRVGRGGGHYDRLIPALRAAGCPVWGLAFDAQMVADVPRQAHDAAVDRVWAARLIEG